MKEQSKRFGELAATARTKRKQEISLAGDAKSAASKEKTRAGQLDVAFKKQQMTVKSSVRARYAMPRD
jgi:hypothetical protein